MSTIKSKTVLVSDATTVIGRDVALGLARAGWFVVVPSDGAAGEAETLVGLIAAEGGRATIVPFDRTTEHQGRGLVGKAITVAGHLDCLISGCSAYDPAVLVAEFAEEFSGDGREGAIITLVDAAHSAFDPVAPSLILSLAPKICINAICHGPVVGCGGHADAADFEQWSSLLFEPMVPTWKIVTAILFILDTPPMTGQIIALDSGEQ